MQRQHVAILLLFLNGGNYFAILCFTTWNKTPYSKLNFKFVIEGMKYTEIGRLTFIGSNREWGTVNSRMCWRHLYLIWHNFRAYQNMWSQITNMSSECRWIGPCCNACRYFVPLLWSAGHNCCSHDRSGRACEAASQVHFSGCVMEILVIRCVSTTNTHVQDG